MKWVGNIVGILLLLFGGVWILQGTNVLAVGFMAGQMQYAFLGIVAAIIGFALLVFTNRRPKAGAGQDRSDVKR